MHLLVGVTARTDVRGPSIFIGNNQRAPRGEGASPDSFSELLKNSPIMFQPSIGVLVGMIAVRPMDDAAFWVPFVFTAVLDRVANPQVRDGWCEIGVVRDQQRLSGRQPDDETLMDAAALVIRKQSCHDARTLNLRVARRGSQYCWRRCDPLFRLDGRVLPRASGARHCGHCDENEQMQGMRRFQEPPMEIAPVTFKATGSSTRQRLTP